MQFKRKARVVIRVPLLIRNREVLRSRAPVDDVVGAEHGVGELRGVRTSATAILGGRGLERLTS